MSWFGGSPEKGFLAGYLNLNDVGIHIGQRARRNGQADKPIIRSKISCPSLDRYELRDPVSGTYGYGYNNQVGRGLDRNLANHRGKTVIEQSLSKGKKRHDQHFQ